MNEWVHQFRSLGINWMWCKCNEFCYWMHKFELKMLFVLIISNYSFEFSWHSHEFSFKIKCTEKFRCQLKLTVISALISLREEKKTNTIKTLRAWHDILKRQSCRWTKKKKCKAHLTALNSRANLENGWSSLYLMAVFKLAVLLPWKPDAENY